MLRSLSIIAVVAGVATAINHFESALAQRQSPVSQLTWVRTVDGWEPSSVLTIKSAASPPSLHPSLVASFQLGASLFALLAFPSRQTAAPVSRGGLPTYK